MSWDESIENQPIGVSSPCDTFGGRNAVFYPDPEVLLTQDEFAKLHQRIGFLESVMLTVVKDNVSDDRFDELQAAYDRICGKITVKQ